MGFFGWIVLGLAGGAIAKLILPGRQGSGWLSTLLIGIVGAFVGGLLGSWIFNIGLGSFFSIRTWLLAILGSLGVLFVWTKVRGRNRNQA